MKRLNRLWSRRRSWSSPGPSWPPENAKNTQIWKIWKRQKHTNFEKIYRQLEELVRYISCRIAQSLSRWVRENHRGNRDPQRVAGCLQTEKRKKKTFTFWKYFKKSPELSCGRGQLSSQDGSFPLSGSEKFPSALVGSCTIHSFNFATFPPMMINSGWKE